MSYFVLIGPKGRGVIDSAWDSSESPDAGDLATDRAQTLKAEGVRDVRIVRRKCKAS